MTENLVEPYGKNDYIGPQPLAPNHQAGVRTRIAIFPHFFAALAAGAAELNPRFLGIHSTVYRTRASFRICATLCSPVHLAVCPLDGAPRDRTARSERFPRAGHFSHCAKATSLQPAASPANCIRVSMHWKILRKLRAKPRRGPQRVPCADPGSNPRIFSVRLRVSLRKAGWRIFVFRQARSHRLLRSATIVISTEYRIGPGKHAVRSGTRRADANRTWAVADPFKTGVHSRLVSHHETTWPLAEERRPTL
jgi:hypothetical protein